MLAAAVLAAGGARFVVVGSVALWAGGVDTAPHDLDVVPDPTPANLEFVVCSLPGLGVLARHIPAPGTLRSLTMTTFSTAYGTIDVLLQRGREEYLALADHASRVVVAGVPVAVASLYDATRLRNRFKSGPRHG